MARLRAENEEEEQQLTAHDQSGGPEDNKPRPKEVFVQVDEAELEGLDEQEQMRRCDVCWDSLGDSPPPRDKRWKIIERVLLAGLQPRTRLASIDNT
jgi:hypothetical protein